MNACKAAPSFEAGDKYGQMLLFLEEDEGYWLDNDTWDVRDSVFARYWLTVSNRHATKQIHFSTFKEGRLKNEARFYLAYSLKNRLLSPVSVFNSCKAPLDYLASFMNSHGKGTSFNGVEIGDIQLVRFLAYSGLSGQ